MGWVWMPNSKLIEAGTEKNSKKAVTSAAMPSAFRFLALWLKA